jgi:thiamine kinase-like enzyme
METLSHHLVNFNQDLIFTLSEESMAGEGGLSSHLSRIQIIYKDGKRETYIHKTTEQSRLSTSISLGLAREALFYSSWSRNIETIMGKGSLPTIYGSTGCMITGMKSILLESIENSVQAGYLFGQGSPHNWKKDLQYYESIATIDSTSLSSIAFKMMARLHRAYWNKHELLISQPQASWLRGSEWYIGQNQESWEKSQSYAATCWAQTLAKIKKISTDKGKISTDVETSTDKGMLSTNESGAEKVNWDPLLIDIINASIKSVSWETYQSQLSSSTFTLVHGDFHPANMLWVPATKRLVMLDWENIGVGSGPQDCAQFLISHTNPLIRATIEEKLMKDYYEELTSDGDIKIEPLYTFDQCYNDYIKGGSERWIWLLCILSTMCPPKMVQYFHDQTIAFMTDHNVTPLNVGMPRV